MTISSQEKATCVLVFLGLSQLGLLQGTARPTIAALYLVLWCACGFELRQAKRVGPKLKRSIASHAVSRQGTSLIAIFLAVSVSGVEHGARRSSNGARLCR
ncbi:hypothetical protein B0T24DRAFT_51310 [Lasiosphaeria ovina]|uniref:Uncharacterized protein n=1 Tax=Lasiosphaeria ovina TaxID=92902 RepID=A0AAE0NL60_9PEZI|nr:hypothetical protein B0T24DRAFT_51310 [Lasiosphaeria ovina]